MSLDRNIEIERLNQAERHISDGERAVANQLVEIERLRACGHDTALAMRTLNNFEITLLGMKEHRDQILKTIEDIDAGLL